MANGRSQKSTWNRSWAHTMAELHLNRWQALVKGQQQVVPGALEWVQLFKEREKNFTKVLTGFLFWFSHSLSKPTASRTKEVIRSRFPASKEPRLPQQVVGKGGHHRSLLPAACGFYNERMPKALCLGCPMESSPIRQFYGWSLHIVNKCREVQELHF